MGKWTTDSIVWLCCMKELEYCANNNKSQENSEWKKLQENITIPLYKDVKLTNKILYIWQIYAARQRNKKTQSAVCGYLCG